MDAPVRRVLLLITDLEIGGTPTVVRELAIRLRNEQTDVQVACLSKWGPVADQLRDAGVHVTAFDADGVWELPAIAVRLIRRIHREQIDTVLSFLVHANTLAALAAIFCKRVRFIQSIQTTQPTPRWHWRLQSIVQHAAERIVVPSPSTAEVARNWASVPGEKLVVIPNAVDVPAREEHGRAAHATKTVGFIGRLDPIKRIPDLLEAMELLDRGIDLRIYGEGEQRAQLESIIQNRGLANRVMLCGAIPSPSKALEEIDVLVLPSAAEGFGLVLIEAMVAGVPVVATNVAGIRDVVQDGKTGLLVPVASPDRLARAIERILTDATLRNRLTDAAYEAVGAKFSWEIVLPLYRQLLA